MCSHRFIGLCFVLLLGCGVGTAGGRSVITLPRVVADASNDASGKSRWVGVLAGEYLAFRLQASTVPLIRSEKLAAGTEAGVIAAQCELSRDGKTFHLYVERQGKNLGVFEESVPLERFGSLLDSCAGWILSAQDSLESLRLSRSLAMTALSPDPRQIRELGRLCTVAESGERVALIEAAEAALLLFDTDSRSLAARYFAAIWLDRACEWPRAHRLYGELLVVVPEDAGLYALQAASARRFGNNAAALAAARTAEQRGLRTPALMLEGALALESQGKHDAAGRIVAGLMVQDSTCSAAWEFTARGYMRMNMPAEALAAADRALALERNAGALFQKGRALSALKRNTEAEECLLAGAADPATAREAWPILARLAAAEGKQEKARGYWDEALKTDPGNLALHFQAAEYVRLCGDNTAALAILERARGRFAASAELDRRIADLRFAMNDTAGSVRFYEQALEKNKGDTLALLSLGRLWVSAGKWDRVTNIGNRLAVLQKDRIPSQLLLGTAALRTGDLRGAVSTLTAVQKKVPGDTAVAHLLGEAWYRLGNGAEAATQYRKIVHPAIEPLRAVEAAEAFYLAGDWQAADRWFTGAGQGLSPSCRLKWVIANVYLKNSAAAGAHADLLPVAGLPGELSFRAAELFDKGKDSPRADRLYRAALAAGMHREESLLALLRLSSGDKRFADAALHARALADLMPDKYRSLLCTAAELFESVDSAAAAARSYERFLQTGPATPAAVIGLARIKATQGDNPSLVMLAGKMKPSQADRADDMIVFACALMQAERFSEAQQWFRESTQRYPSLPDGWEGLALTAQSTGDAKTALAANRKLLDMGSAGTRSESAWRTAQIYETEEDRTAALEQYRTNIRQFPDDLRNYDRFIELCRAAHLPAEARDAAVRAAELSGGDPASLKRAGELERTTRQLRSVFTSSMSKHDPATARFMQRLVPCTSSAIAAVLPHGTMRLPIPWPGAPTKHPCASVMPSPVITNTTVPQGPTSVPSASR